MKADQVDVIAASVLRDFEKVDDTVEPRTPREFRCDIRKPDRFNRIDLNLPFVHRIACADSDALTHPDPHATGDLAPTDAVAQTFGEDHGRILIDYTRHDGRVFR